MCFDNDADWYASINEVTESDSGPACRCCECDERIAETDWRQTIHQVEHESCQDCDDELPDDECFHDYGETFDGSLCRTCVRMLAAIEEIEIEAGCKEGHRQPLGGELWESVYGDARYNDGRYVRRAVAK